jgi:hypothetical protein
VHCVTISRGSACPEVRYWSSREHHLSPTPFGRRTSPKSADSPQIRLGTRLLCWPICSRRPADRGEDRSLMDGCREPVAHFHRYRRALFPGQRCELRSYPAGNRTDGEIFARNGYSRETHKRRQSHLEAGLCRATPGGSEGARRGLDLAHFSGEPKSLNCRSPRSRQARRPARHEDRRFPARAVVVAINDLERNDMRFRFRSAVVWDQSEAPPIVIVEFFRIAPKISQQDYSIDTACHF